MSTIVYSIYILRVKYRQRFIAQIDEEVRGLKEEILRGKKELLDEEEKGKEATLTLQSARNSNIKLQSKVTMSVSKSL